MEGRHNFGFVRDDYSNKEIARKLGLNEPTESGLTGQLFREEARS